ncbi:MAG: DUF6364 family protein, partial [Chitinophagaceae bacterium]
MVTKLTLTVDGNVIEAAKEYAHQSNRSLSKIVEDYLRSIIEDKKGKALSSKLKRIHGAVKLPKGFDEKAEIR